MNDLVLRAHFSSFAIHFWMAMFLTASTVLGLVTQSFSNNLVLVGMVLLSMLFALQFLAGRFRSSVELSQHELSVTNSFRPKQTFSDQQIKRVEVRNRWWSYLAYGAIGSFEVSSPVAYVIDQNGQSHRLAATAPIRESSVTWQLLTNWLQNGPYLFAGEKSVWRVGSTTLGVETYPDGPEESVCGCEGISFATPYSDTGSSCLRGEAGSRFLALRVSWGCDGLEEVPVGRSGLELRPYGFVRQVVRRASSSGQCTIA